MNDFLELEINLLCRDEEKSSYSVEVRVNDLRLQILRAPEREAVRFHKAQLDNHKLNPVAYGKQLFKNLFAPANVLRLYDEARAVAQRENRPLRLRLFTHSDALDLQDLRWETLYDERPGGGWLLTNERLLFCRFLNSSSWEPVTPRTADELPTLVVIANPSDLATKTIFAGGSSDSGNHRPLAPVDVTQEIQRAQQGLGELFKEEHLLASDPLHPGQVTLDRVLERLREGFDIVYLACHGALITRREQSGPQLLLEKPSGTPDVGTSDLVSGTRVAEQMQNLAPERRPRLVVLASCQSAGSGGEAVTADALGALAALGPQLAQAGVPAVVAMQGSVSMDTVASFMPTFFQELRKDGQIDRAVAVARSTVTQRPDSWMPVLYLRLRDGQLLAPGVNERNSESYRKALAYRDISRTMAMTFVDLMRLLYVASSDVARRYNVKRYIEFIDVANHHFSDFRSQIERYSLALDPQLQEQITDLERRLNWVLMQLKRGPNFGGGHRQYFNTMKQIGDGLHDLCLTTTGGAYTQVVESVRTQIDHSLKQAHLTLSSVSLDGIFVLRLEVQRHLLKASGSSDSSIFTIDDDIDQSFAIQYFILDHQLLYRVRGQSSGMG